MTLQIGTVLEDGYIVAGVSNGRTFAVAPANKRVVRPFGFYEVALPLEQVSMPCSCVEECGDINTQKVIQSKNLISAEDYAITAAAYAETLGASIPTLTELNIINTNFELIDSADTTSGTSLSLIRNGPEIPEPLESETEEEYYARVGVIEYVSPFVWSSTNHQKRSWWFLTLNNNEAMASFKTMENWVIPIRFLD